MIKIVYEIQLLDENNKQCDSETYVKKLNIILDKYPRIDKLNWRITQSRQFNFNYLSIEIDETLIPVTEINNIKNILKLVTSIKSEI